MTAGATVGKLNVELGLDQSKFNAGLDQAEGKSKSAGGRMAATFGKAGAVLGTALVAGAAMGTAALVGLGKKSLDLYADYEQLAGGVETLFKTSSDTLIGYADQAYITAGVSANQYMETVTSFSASLIASLGGDTDKAVKVADMAMIDMADNANKMGSDMESIQNAYQGFAKQNFTMLDNLKLGFGGTKEEMQRLLDEAGKISGVEYDISNFADITSAIHVMQEELGIAGATALEAETTITGSINTLKASFENLLTGLGDPSADIKALTDNVIGAFNNVLTNITPIIENILSAMPTAIAGIVQAISDLLPAIVDTLAGLLPIAVSAVASIIPALAELIPVIIQAIVSALPALIEAAGNIIMALITGIVEAIPILAEAIPQIMLTIVEKLIELLPVIIEGAINIIVALAYGLIDALPILIEAIPTLIEAIVTTLIELLPLIIDASVEIILAIVGALIDNAPLLIEAIFKIGDILVKAIIDLIPKLWDAGKQLIKGLVDGMKDFNIGSALSDIGNNIVGGFKDIFGIQSPSKVMRDEIGKYLMPGITSALPAGVPNAVQAIDSAVGGLMGGLQAPAAAGGAGGVSIVIENISLMNGGAAEAQKAGDIIGQRVVSAVQKARGRGN